MGSSLPAASPVKVDRDALARASHAVREVVETVFRAVAEIGVACSTRLAAVAAEGRRPHSSDFASLRPHLHSRLQRGDLVSGLGFVAALDLLSDTAAWLEWWQGDATGRVTPLVLDLEGSHSSYADYTHWDWYAHPRDTGRRIVAGPYVDYLCSEEYSLTFSLPIAHDGRFAGVAAADVYLRHFEAAIVPSLRRLSAPARLVNSRGRVTASTDPHHLAGSLTKACDFASLSAGPLLPSVHNGLTLFPCEGTSLVLVTPAD